MSRPDFGGDVFAVAVAAVASLSQPIRDIGDACRETGEVLRRHARVWRDAARVLSGRRSRRAFTPIGGRALRSKCLRKKAGMR